jgi:hypothetical protein
MVKIIPGRICIPFFGKLLLPKNKIFMKDGILKGFLSLRNCVSIFAYWLLDGCLQILKMGIIVKKGNGCYLMAVICNF